MNPDHSHASLADAMDELQRSVNDSFSGSPATPTPSSLPLSHRLQDDGRMYRHRSHPKWSETMQKSRISASNVDQSISPQSRLTRDSLREHTKRLESVDDVQTLNADVIRQVSGAISELSRITSVEKKCADTRPKSSTIEALRDLRISLEAVYSREKEKERSLVQTIQRTQLSSLSPTDTIVNTRGASSSAVPKPHTTESQPSAAVNESTDLISRTALDMDRLDARLQAVFSQVERLEEQNNVLLQPVSPRATTPSTNTEDEVRQQSTKQITSAPQSSRSDAFSDRMSLLRTRVASLAARHDSSKTAASSTMSLVSAAPPDVSKGRKEDPSSSHSSQPLFKQQSESALSARKPLRERRTRREGTTVQTATTTPDTSAPPSRASSGASSPGMPAMSLVRFHF